ncbi:MAG: fumarylacetoacetate hydrolase family protein [Steroidobacteraceae bacterium]
MSTLFSLKLPTVSIHGTQSRFPVHRIYCVGQNYADHAREMGSDPVREPPFFFSKPADAVVIDSESVPYPSRTQNLHHEIELVVAIGTEGRDIPVERARDHIFGYAVGNDLTRRDLQAQAKGKGRPWDVAKGFDASAPLTAIRRAEECGHVRVGRIWLEVNGQLKQQADIRDMIWSVDEIIAELSTFYRLQPGDLIFTGTPAGVGPIQRGDVLLGGIDGIDTLRSRLL